MTIGIIGSGKLGITLAQLALRAGYQVVVSGSTRNTHLELTVSGLAPGAQAESRATTVAISDLIILAIPLSKYKEIHPDEFANKLVIDAMNYWWEVDGDKDALLSKEHSSSEQVQSYFSSARIVKALNHIGYHDLHDHSNQSGTGQKRAIAIAGNVAGDKAIVSSFINKIGFDTIDIGDLANGRKLEPGSKAFGVSVEKNELMSYI